MTDQLHRFHFQSAPARGHWVKLTDAWRDACQFQSYPNAVRDALGQMLAVVSMLAHNIKFDGAVALQSLGNGPLSMALAECRNRRFIRGIARENEERRVIGSANFRELIGDGQLALSLLPSSGGTYQGLVQLTAPDLASNIENYFATSEQLETKIRLVVTEDGDEPCVVGCLLQRLPDEDHATEIEMQSNDDAWRRVSTVFETMREAELAALNVDDLLRRLFRHDLIRVDDGRAIEFRCPCSKERTEDALHTIGAEELAEILKCEGLVRVTCEFCGALYTFHAGELALH